MHKTGNVPIKKFKALVKEYTGEDYDYNIPKCNRNLNKQMKNIGQIIKKPFIIYKKGEF